MEASKVSYFGSPHHAFYPLTHGIRRGGSRGTKAAQAAKSYCSSPQASLSPGRTASMISLLPPAVGVLSNLASGLSVWAAEEASSSSSSSSLSMTTEGASSQVSASAVGGAGGAASSTLESVAGATSQAVKASVDRVGAVVSGAAPATVTGNENTVINILGSAAFVGLSLLTIGVVYLFITDFLEKRKRDEEMKKLNEEERAARQKKGGSLAAASKGGAKGFGKKRPVDDDE